MEQNAPYLCIWKRMTGYGVNDNGFLGCSEKVTGIEAVVQTGWRDEEQQAI